MIYKNADHKNFLITTTIAILVFYFPLIIWNDYYKDDYFRVVLNKPDWGVLGRPFADIFAYFLSADWQFLPDSSPFFLIVALAIIIFSTCYTLSVRNIPFNALTAVLLISFIFNPFLLSALLYRFDCVIMSASIAFSLFAWAYFPKSKGISALFCFISMGFYQAYINIFIVLIILEGLYNIYRGKRLKDVFNFFLSAFVLVFLTALIFYFFDKLFIEEFARTKSTFIFMGDKNIGKYLAVLVENVYSHYFGFLSPTGKVIYGLAICVSLIEIQLHFYKDTLYSHRVVRAAISSLALVFMLPISLGVLLGIVGNSRIEPRLMVQSIFFSVVIVFLVIRFLTRLQAPQLLTSYSAFAKTKFSWLVIGYLLLCPLVFSYIVNSAIRNQNHRTDYLSQQLAMSLENYPKNKPAFILGKFGNTAFIKNLIPRMRLVAHMVPDSADWVLWLSLKEYGHDKIAFRNPDLADTKKYIGQLCSEHVQPDLKKQFYTIYNFTDHLFIWLGNKDICLTEYNPFYIAQKD